MKQKISLQTDHPRNIYVLDKCGSLLILFTSYNVDMNGIHIIVSPHNNITYANLIIIVMWTFTRLNYKTRLSLVMTTTRYYRSVLENICCILWICAGYLQAKEELP